MEKPKQTEQLQLNGAAGKLEAALRLPAGDPQFCGLVCHPHPLYGGSFNNKVVTTLERTAVRAGGVVLRFNFRGVGQSEGLHDGGLGETVDTVQLASWLRDQYPDLPFWVAGFSFGSMVASRAAAALAEQGHAVSRLLLVAPPVARYQWPTVAECQAPTWVIQGEADEVVEPEEVYAWVEKQTPKPAIMRLPAAGHFFHGQLNALMKAAHKSLP